MSVSSKHQFNIQLEKPLSHRMLSGFIGLVLILTLVACQEAEQVQAVRTAPQVTVTQSVVKTIKKYEIFTGSTQAVESADIVARVAGRLESVEFKASTQVKKGDVLFKIEKEKYQAQRDSALAALQSSRASLALAETEVKRMEQASKNRAVSELDVDTARANRDVANATVRSAIASLAEAELTLSYTDVKSTIDGVVSRRLIDAGNLVGQSGPTMLTRVNTMQPIYVFFNVPESSILNFLDEASESRASRKEDYSTRVKSELERTKHPAFVERANETGFPHQGLINYIDNEVDKNTGTVEVRIKLENKDLKFFPGLFVRVKVPGADIEDAVLIKEVAIGSDLGGKYVLVVDSDNIVSLRYVTLGLPQEDGYVHVISGLEGNETYIVKGLLRARPGLPIKPKTEG
ncbi:MAG: efflux transporter periplasmic adaptor subunit [Gammaproteobacteria bacterium]|nr:MAG: efflux transporter periplasmic adaptor subunit [Gammaproteobacteria bacterium]